LYYFFLQWIINTKVFCQYRRHVFQVLILNYLIKIFISQVNVNRIEEIDSLIEELEKKPA